MSGDILSMHLLFAIIVWIVRRPLETVLPSEQLASSFGFRAVVLESSEAVSCQNAVTLLLESIVVCRIPLRQLAGEAPCH